MPLGVPTIEWAGVSARGTPLPPGSYSFELESMNSGEITSIRPVQHYALVEEARQGADGVEIVLRGGVSLPADQVAALRRPLQDQL